MRRTRRMIAWLWGQRLLVALGAIVGLQALALLHQAMPPIRFAREIVTDAPILICPGASLRYDSELTVDHPRVVLRVARSIVAGHVAPGTSNPTEISDKAPDYSNQWNAGSRVATRIYTPPASLPAGPHTLLVSASGLGTNDNAVSMYAVWFTILPANECKGKK